MLVRNNLTLLRNFAVEIKKSLLPFLGTTHYPAR